MEKRTNVESKQVHYAGESEKRYSDILKTNCQHVARHISDWIKSEELCDFDMSNHDFLVKCFAMNAQERAQMREWINRQDEAVGVSPDDFIDMQNAIGEDIDEVIKESIGDHAEPSEAQERE